MGVYIGSKKKSIRVGSSFTRVLLIPTLKSIAVTTPPTKIKYGAGEIFDPTGMIVTASYSDGSMKVVTGYTIINGDQIAEDMTTVTISYTEDGITATTTYEVEIAKPATITLSFVRSGGGAFINYASVIIDGVAYPTSETDLATTEIIVPIGTVITCKVTSGTTSVTSQKITLNGVTVASGDSEYLYTVVGDATIKSTINTSYSPQTGSVAYGTIAITEL